MAAKEGEIRLRFSTLQTAHPPFLQKTVEGGGGAAGTEIGIVLVEVPHWRVLL